MTKDGNSQPSPKAIEQFRLACQEEAKALGGITVDIKKDTTTNTPVVIVYADPAKSKIDTHAVYKQLYALADRLDIPAAVVPASAVSGSVFAQYPS